jgi:glycosyltransferase involved in cell wall biosynthesis
MCTHDYRTHLIGWLAAGRRKTKWLAFSRGWTRESVKMRLYHTIDKVILRFADHIVAVSEAQRRRLTRLLIPEGNISVVHNAIEPQQFESIEKIDLHLKFGFASDTLVYVSAGRFSREKGQTCLVKAAVAAIMQNPRLRIVLFGDGPDLEKVRHMVTAFGYEDKIRCPGFEKNMLGCIKGADAVVNPSLSEGLPNVVLEAMALGVPVVATDVGGVPEIIIDKETGYLVPPENPRALAEALLYVGRHTEQTRKVAESALRFVNDDLTFDRQNRKLTAVYRKLSSE